MGNPRQVMLHRVHDEGAVFRAFSLHCVWIVLQPDAVAPLLPLYIDNKMLGVGQDSISGSADGGRGEFWNERVLWSECSIRNGGRRAGRSGCSHWYAAGSFAVLRRWLKTMFLQKGPVRRRASRPPATIHSPPCFPTQSGIASGYRAKPILSRSTILPSLLLIKE